MFTLKWPPPYIYNKIWRDLIIKILILDSKQCRAWSRAFGYSLLLISPNIAKEVPFVTIMYTQNTSFFFIDEFMYHYVHVFKLEKFKIMCNTNKLLMTIKLLFVWIFGMISEQVVLLTCFLSWITKQYLLISLPVSDYKFFKSAVRDKMTIRLWCSLMS